jgi:citrate lyase subunit alpha / citrate CoA-transferase
VSEQEERPVAEMVKNAVGRLVPTEVNGKPQVAFKGVAQFEPTGRTAAPPIRACHQYALDKRAPNVRAALERVGLRDGMTIGMHHHMRNGDRIAVPLFETIAAMGVKDIVFAPSALFPCHEPLIKHLESGVIHHIEGSMNGPIGRFCSEGKMRGMGVLRSHGGRYQAIQDGELRIDIGIVPAPTADMMGNANGAYGPSACGSLGFALADSEYADNVIVITDNLVEVPCIPWEIQGMNVDVVVEVEKIGDPSQIVSGTTQITKSPTRVLIAEYVADFIEAAGFLGKPFQAGAGGIALASVKFIADRMRAKGLRAAFARGGSTKYLVEMLNEGLIGAILDGQTFDLDGVRSIGTHPRHLPTTPFTSYNYHGKGNWASYVSTAVLGATEVDLKFQANVVTHSDGLLLHGIGGWQNTLSAECPILAFPLYRNRIPIIMEEVTTICAPGEMIGAVITERGIAVNPNHRNGPAILERLKGTRLPLVTIEELHAIARQLCGTPEPPSIDRSTPVAVVKWVDGTVIDTIYKVNAT